MIKSRQATTQPRQKINTDKLNGLMAVWQLKLSFIKN